MSGTSILSGLSTADLSGALFHALDRNGDQRLSGDEFKAFLERFIAQLTGGRETPGVAPQASDDSRTPTVTPPPSQPATIQQFIPLPSRYVFAGFDPGAHIGETPTVVTPKYAVYTELAKLSAQPGFDIKNFAQQAADDLNAMFNTTQFQAADGETLVYGDEYVHGAPTGYGLPRETAYDPTAPGEFFWGWVESPATATAPISASAAAPRANTVDSTLTGTGGQAAAYLNQEARRVLGRSLTAEEIQSAANQVGYQDGMTVTGAMVNTVVDQMNAHASTRAAG
jgi:hypothetical protein